MTEIDGYVDHIIYRNSENGYTVLVLVSEDKEEITLTGSFRAIEEGQGVRVRGEHTHHPSYGDQFRVQSYEIKEPEDIVSIERYLSSGAVKGVGAAIAKRIVRRFGEESFRIMEEEPERLVEIKGISERIARQIAVQMQEKRGMRRAMIYLQELGISSNLSAKIYAAYGDSLFEVLGENPYRLVEDIQGVGFKTADEIAARAGIAPDSLYRIKSAMLYALSLAQSEGHLYLPKPQLIKKTGELIAPGDNGFYEPDKELTALMEEALTSLIMESKLIEKEGEGETLIFSAAAYFTELDCAVRLDDLDIDTPQDTEETKRLIALTEKQSGIVLDDMQLGALIMAAKSTVCIITGGPGTGKTTIIKMLLDYFDREGLDVMLAAPTGRAAKRMSEATGYEARTIHRVLEIGADATLKFTRDDTNPLETDVVIVDEMSMVDIYLFHAVLKAMTPGMRLIMVGDENQLPSVGPGAVLSDLIRSGRYSVARLDKIFRQAAKSDIVVNAHKINRGERIVMDNKSSDFFFLERSDAAVITESIVYLLTKKLPPYVNAPWNEIQVMTPMKKGLLGSVNLNRALQERLNPPENGKEEYTFGDLLLREGDKVMQVKNNYQTPWEIRSSHGIVIESGTGVFNGDMGVVKAINPEAGMVTVSFDDGREAIYQTQQLEELELAYAITIHKSQGSEYPAVVLPILSGPSMLMTRNLLYTAVTRAKKCVMLIGSRAAIFDMIDNISEQRRYTALAERINERRTAL